MNETIHGIKIALKHNEHYNDYTIILPQAEHMNQVLKVNVFKDAVKIYEHAKQLAEMYSEVNYIALLLQEFKENLK